MAISKTEIERTKQEDVKEDSVYLKGTIEMELAYESLPEVSKAAYEILKFHGSYQGANRDTMTERKKAGLEKEVEYMVRLKIPGGRMTADQYLKMDELAEEYANGTLRITTRQTFQFHVVLKNNLKKHIAAINHALLTTLGGCGDVVRNVTASPAPIDDVKHRRLREDTDRIAAFCAPKTSAYNEIWLDGKNEGRKSKNDVEPLYGRHYLPRKFKIGLITPEDNLVDVFTHDLGFVLIFEGEELKGYNILMGGGMGMKHEAAKDWDDKETYPRVATPMAFAGPDDLLNAVEAVVKLQRDHGDRTERQHARLKYLLDDNGLDWTRKTLEKYFNATNPSQPLQDPVSVEKYEIPSHMGWHDQKNGKLYLGIPVPSGRIIDYDKPNPSKYTEDVSGEFKDARYRTGLRTVIEEYGMNIVLTPTEEIILCNVDPGQKEEIENKLRNFGIPLAEDHTPFQLHYMTCVALPTCAKALAESERVQFTLMDDIQAVMDKHGVGQEKITVRVTGCPNGCARPYVGDIGIVGRMPGHYVLFIGGDFEGTRLNTKVFDKVPQADIAKALDPMFALYATEKNDGEGFGDFCTRVGIEKVVEQARGQLGDYKWAA